MDEDEISDPDRTALRSETLAERARVERQLASLERTVAQLLEFADLEPADDEHDPDGTTAYERAQVVSLAAAARARLAELDQALATIEAEGYGACERCGRPIGVDRLLALPETILCVVCARGGHRAPSL